MSKAEDAEQNNQMILSSQVLAERIIGLSKEVSELKGRFDSFTLNFVPMNVYNIRHEELVKDLNTVKEDVMRIKSNRWLIGLILAAAGGLLTFLIQFALTHK